MYSQFMMHGQKNIKRCRYSIPDKDKKYLSFRKRPSLLFTWHLG